MAEPTCRSCYAATLTADERDRFNAEPVTSCVYLCPKHGKAMANDLAALPIIRYVKALPFPGFTSAVGRATPRSTDRLA